jgi:hypothetical protein
MTKREAEKAICYLATTWAGMVGIQQGQAEMPDFGAFLSWARAEGYGHYFNFRSTTGPMEDAEGWINQELGQSWRNLTVR